MEGLDDSMELPNLYPHQDEHKDRVRVSLKANRSVILCANPGVGKTRMSKWILGKSSRLPASKKRSGYSLFAVHRRGLVDNASLSFSESPALPHGVIMSQREAEWHQRVQVASIDTLLSWFCDGSEYKTDLTYDLIVFDECHSHHSKLQTFLNAHNLKRELLGLPEPFIVGLSATPQAQGLADLYKEIVTGPTTQWLIDNKFLSPYRYFRATTGQIQKLVRSGDDFTSDSVADAMSGLAGDLVRDWKKYADGRATIGFFPRRQHAKEAMELLRANGVSCEYIDGETSDIDRNAIFKTMNSGGLQYICNVGVVERGTDIPRVGCVQMCTAVGSIVRWRQMIGRGSRVHPAVPDCIVIDHGGNISRHGFFEDEVLWSLDWSKRPSKEHSPQASVACPACAAMYRGGRCPCCGYEPKKKELLAQGLLFDGSELKEVKAKSGSTTELKKKSNEEILINCLYRAGKSGKNFKQALGMAYKTAENQGTQFRVPKRFTVAGKVFESIPRDDAGSTLRVAKSYPFTVGDYSESSNVYLTTNSDA